ncbi:hypothetical protein HMPREF3291_18280 [Bacillus sp. HMSC76G11]|nr:hypothetical protein HMPREF3291_18280 [Bacillus sp. HMSC76G11]
MIIHCGKCKIKLLNEDLVVMDDLNILRHKGCYIYNPKFVKEIDTYKNIKDKYWFFQETVH